VDINLNYPGYIQEIPGDLSISNRISEKAIFIGRKTMSSGRA